MPEIVVYRRPIPKARPRMGNGRTYTPRTTERAEHFIQDTWRQSGFGMQTGPLRIEVWCYLKRPAAHYGTGRNSARLRESAPVAPMDHLSGDWDNLGKLAADALQGVAYANDAAIIDGVVHKRYAELGGAECWRIGIFPAHPNISRFPEGTIQVFTSSDPAYCPSCHGPAGNGEGGRCSSCQSAKDAAESPTRPTRA